jgi:DNA topoisomerase-2
MFSVALASYMFLVLQVSFVNKATTFVGGPHVDYVSNQITEYVASFLNKKGWRANKEEHEVKRHLWIFINMLVENPNLQFTNQGGFGWSSWKFGVVQAF